MFCRHCGTEIADKAIVCFRCGMATAEPRVTPAQPQKARRSSLAAAALGLIILAIAALYMGQASADRTPAMAGWALATMAAVLLVMRIVGRRHR